MNRARLASFLFAAVAPLLATSAAGATSKAVASAFATPLEAAQFLAGPGVTVTNATWDGEIGVGAFSGAAAAVGFDMGVMLTTGFIDTVLRPNQFFNTSGVHELGRGGRDEDLEQLVPPHRTYDATVLEFDVTTGASTIAITYVFASEEHNEFVGEGYGDVMAIYVNGVNCARIGAEPVSVDTINNSRNIALYVDNTGAVRETEMDGLTVTLTCTAQVTPNAPNRVKLAIADVSDPFYDSVVFLMAQSIVPGGPPQPGAKALAVEYFHQGFGHYFVTADPDEIAGLDAGTIAGWQRTGESFDVWTTGTGLAEVCRFFTTAFAPKSSHFYTARSAECDAVGRDPAWQFEKVAYLVALPDPGGQCPVGVTLFRLYNGGQTGAPNHRYTTRADLRAQMIAQGFVPEDDASECVPE